jgi:hypothetical protein
MMVELNLRPETRQLRQFGWIALAAFGVIGAVVLFRGGLLGISFGAAARPIAFALWTLGVLSGLLSLVWPEGNRPLFVALGVLTFPIGWVLSHVVLAVVFFGVLTPVGLLFRLFGRDPLERAFRPEMKSYWVDLPEVKDDGEYFRQF